MFPDPPSQHVPAIVTILLSCLPLLYSIPHICFVAKVFLDLVRRDQELPEGRDTKLKLGVKLAKWINVEVGKISPDQNITPGALLPYITLIKGLLEMSATLPREAGAKLALDLAAVTDTLAAQMNRPRLTRQDRRIQRHATRIIEDILEGKLDLVHEILDDLIKSSDPARSVVLIGVIVRLRFRRPNPEPINDRKDPIMTLYATHILGSKTAVPPHRATALQVFLQMCLNKSTFADKLLPVAERLLLRSPEVCLPTTTALIQCLPDEVADVLPGKLLGASLSASKSSNADTRTKALELFTSLSGRCYEEDKVKGIVTETLALPKTGKTASPEHRVTLYNMIAAICPKDAVSALVLETIVPLLSKETNEPALQAASAAIHPHLRHVLASDVSNLGPTITVLAKELNSSRLPTRRAVSEAFGAALWSPTGQAKLSAEGEKLVGTLVTGLESNLQTALGNLPTNIGGFLEGYVAAALVIGPLSQLGSAKKVAGGVSISALLTLLPRPSFLLNDKVYWKLSASVDGVWFARSLVAVLTSRGSALKADISK